MPKSFVSVYEPAEIEIDGILYKVRRRNRTVMRQLSQIEEKLLKDDVTNATTIELSYEQVGLLVDAPQDVIDGLDQRQVNEITRWVVSAATGKAEPDEGEEKNAAKPGDGTPPA